MPLVFVYGTLKRGFPNAEGMDGARYLGTYRTCDAYPLVVGGKWFSPSLLPEKGLGQRVTGELYVVDNAMLARLDALESTHLPTGYRREQIGVESLADGSVISAWVYFKERNRITAIHSENLAEYHDQRYVPLAQRAEA